MSANVLTVKHSKIVFMFEVAEIQKYVKLLFEQIKMYD
jgi:hypothetical protein